MKTRLLFVFATALAASFFEKSSAYAQQAIYAPPFPNVRSVFGPRHDANTFHSGLDYSASASTSAPAISNGRITQIGNNGDACGNRVYLLTSSGHEFGYCHLFSSSDATSIQSGNFTLIKGFQFIFPANPKRRKPAKTVTCDVLLDASAKRMLVPQVCFMKNQTRTINNVEYAVVNQVALNDGLAAVGHSGLGNPANAHLHLNYNRSKDNPQLYIAHPNGTFCARLSAAGDSTSACDAVASVPVISVEKIGANPYLEVRIDSTARLDLDQLDFTISSTPLQSYNLRYGGTEDSAPWINQTNEIKKYISLTCTEIPSPSEVLICPVDWKGQKDPSSRLETKVRLGISPSLMTIGAYTLTAQLSPVTGQAQSIQLPFNIAGFSATLLVPDLQTGWAGLPATISLTDLVETTRSAFQVSGNSSTCGTGERGSPLYSNSVPDDAKFYGARTVTGVPYTLSGPGINRRNCSSFVAVKMIPSPIHPELIKPRIWINGTGRGQSFSPTTTRDWESQVRNDSGDPWSGAGKSCTGGTVANAGFFGANWTSANCSATLTE